MLTSQLLCFCHPAERSLNDLNQTEQQQQPCEFHQIFSWSCYPNSPEAMKPLISRRRYKHQNIIIDV